MKLRIFPAALATVLGLALALSLTGCAFGMGRSGSAPEQQKEFGSNPWRDEEDEAASAAAEPADARPAATPKPTPEPTPEPGPEIEVVDGITYVDGILIANKSYALPSDYDPGFDAATQAAFDEMAAAAASEGLNLYIASGYRSYDYQAGLYQRYVNRDGQAAADTYSARPGHSEHQTGLALDLNSISDSFANTSEGQWVAAHCQEYGFILRYPADKEEITGYKYEPWHLRYLGVEQATAVAESGLCLEEYLGIDSVYAE